MTLGGYVENAAGRKAVEDAMQAARTGSDVLIGALDRVLAAGLELRDGMVLGGGHAIFYLQLREMGAEPSAHVVCDSCWLVFRPLRKTRVAKCDVCNSSRALPHGQIAHHPDGLGYSLGGRFAGTTHIRTCACCGETFSAGSATTLYCGGACRKAASERRSRPPARSSAARSVDSAVVAAQLQETLDRALPILRAIRIDPETRVDGRTVIDEALGQSRARRRRETH